MNHKIITGIVCILIVVCLAVGIGMNNKSGNSENKTNLILDKETVSAVVENSSFITEKESETNSIKTENEAEPLVKSSVKKEKEPTTLVKNPLKNNVKKESKPTASAKTTVKPENEAKPPVKLSVSFSVNCEKAAAYDVGYPNYLISKTKCKVENGTTVFDLLSGECSKNGIAVVHQNKSYIKAIGGLSEKDCGNASGWIYKVNGEKPMMAASKYVLKDGDVVEWYYVTSPTD